MYPTLKGRKRARADSASSDGARRVRPTPATTFTSPSHTNGPAPSEYAPKPRQWQKTKSTILSTNIVNTRISIPDWYNDISHSTHLAAFNRGEKQELVLVKDYIQYCLDARIKGDKDEESRYVDHVRDRVHRMEGFPFLSLALIKESKVLESKGLPIIFSEEPPYEGLFPWDVKADAKTLYNRWWKGDIDGSVLRGIEVRKNTLSTGTKGTSKMLEKGYTKRDANVVGENGLVNGMWWPDRRCVWRDGAHSSLEAGICGVLGKGAYAVVVSSNEYADRDNGEVLEYCGTESTTSEPTRYTKMMQEAFATQQPIRVIRAAKKGSLYAPYMGYRYDGLYTITNEETLSTGKFMARFTLKRKEGQDPIRFEGKESRPTAYEMNEYTKIKALLKG